MPPASANAYALGHSPREQRRLQDQAAILRRPTLGLLRDAGIGPGMHVLDAGCGAGDVSLLVAELVGPSGSVVGLDRSEDVLATARRRARVAGAGHARFVRGDVAEWRPTGALLGRGASAGRAALVGQDGPFDAVVGRCILMHQRDPGACLEHLVSLARPGAPVAFAEIMVGAVGLERRPLLRACAERIDAALDAAGVRTDLPLHLTGLLEGCGVADARLRLDAVPTVARDRAYARWIVETLRSLMPVVRAQGIATDDEVGLETLAERIADEGARNPGSASCAVVGGAHGRVPGLGGGGAARGPAPS